MFNWENLTKEDKLAMARKSPEIAAMLAEEEEQEAALAASIVTLEEYRRRVEETKERLRKEHGI